MTCQLRFRKGEGRCARATRTVKRICTPSISLSPLRETRPSGVLRSSPYHTFPLITPHTFQPIPTSTPTSVGFTHQGSQVSGEPSSPAGPPGLGARLIRSPLFPFLHLSHWRAHPLPTFSLAPLPPTSLSAPISPSATLSSLSRARTRQSKRYCCSLSRVCIDLRLPRGPNLLPKRWMCFSAARSIYFFSSVPAAIGGCSRSF